MDYLYPDYSYYRSTILIPEGFVPWTIRILLDHSYHGPFIPSMDFLYPGRFYGMNSPGGYKQSKVQLVQGTISPGTVQVISHAVHKSHNFCKHPVMKERSIGAVWHTPTRVMQTEKLYPSQSSTAGTQLFKGGIASKTIFTYIMRRCQLKRMAGSFES